jgi:hypothetical protein
MAEWYEQDALLSDTEPKWYEQDSIAIDTPTETYFDNENDPFDLKKQRIQKEARSFWQTVSNELVGEEAEWGEYWSRGIGKSNLSLISQYYFNKEIGYGWEKAFSEEPEDTGILERLVESVGTLVGDLPTFAIGAVPAGIATAGNPFAIGFAGGFVNESLKTTYLKALQRGDVDSFSEWWKIYTEEGIKEGAKSGLILGTTLQFPSLIGAKGYFASLATQVTAYEAMGIALNGELPTKETLINDILLFGAFNLTSKGSRTAIKEQVSKGKSSLQVLQEMISDPTKIVDAVSLNLDKFRSKSKVENKVQPYKEPETKLPEPVKEKPLTAEEKALYKNVKSTIKDKTTKEKIKQGVQDIKDGFKESMLDALYPVKKIVKAFSESKPKGALDPYQLLRLQPGMVARALEFFDRKPIKFDLTEIPGAKNMNTILKDVTSETSRARLELYVIGKRALELEGRKINTGYSKEQLNQFKKYTKENAFKYEKVSQELGIFQDNILKYMEEAGLIDKTTIARMKEANKDYVPWSKVVEDPKTNFGSGTGKVKNPFKKMKGVKEGEKAPEIFSPLETIHKNTLHYIQLAERNYAYNKFIEMVERNPDLAQQFGIKKLEKKPKVTEVTVKEIADALGQTPELLKSAGVEPFLIFRKEANLAKEGQLLVYRKKLNKKTQRQEVKAEYWELPPDLAKSLTGANRYSMSLTQKILSMPTRVLRTGVTLDPAFLLRNLVRDGFISTVVSRQGYAFPMARTIQGMYHMFNRTKLYQEFVKSGAAQSTFFKLEQYFGEGIKESIGSRTVFNQIGNKPIQKFVEFLKTAGDYSEQGAKIGEFIAVRKNLQKNSKLSYREQLERAGFEARDIFDFAKQGTKAEVYNRFSAFFTSRLRGYEKLYESAKENPKSFLMKTTLNITLPSVFLWWVNHDDPLYQRLPDWRKDLFWNIPVGKGLDIKLYEQYLNELGDPELALQQAMKDSDHFFLTIPKPWEMGLLFGTLAEKALDFAFKEDEKAITDFFIDSSVDFIKQNALALPDVPRIAVEQYTNKSIFFDRPIVPSNVANEYMPEFEYDRRTSETAKFLGAKLSFSPKRIDSLIANLTGSIGRQTVDFIDFVAEQTGLVDVDDFDPWSTDWIKNLDKLPFVKSFVVRQPGMSSSHISEFWDHIKKTEDAVKAHDQLIKEGEFEKAAKIAETPEFLLGSSDVFQGHIESMRILKKTIDVIYNLENFILEDSQAQEILQVASELTKELGKKPTIKQIVNKVKISVDGIPILLLEPLVRDVVGGGKFFSTIFPKPNEKVELLDNTYAGMIEIAKVANQFVKEFQKQ